MIIKEEDKKMIIEEFSKSLDTYDSIEIEANNVSCSVVHSLSTFHEEKEVGRVLTITLRRGLA
jgi:hypothetical protein